MLEDVVLPLLASPELAEPPLVLPDTLAEPELALWLFQFDTSRSFHTVRLQLQVLVLHTWLFEPGPVVLMLTVSAEASPPTPNVAMSVPLVAILANNDIALIL